jgi:tetratricopeptide (TPR) repeat protein
MLFDLRGRGRRRTVQAIYLTLAILMGGGLVLFGIGGATSGGLVDAINGGGSGGGGNETFDKRVEDAQKRTTASPTDERAWAALARAQYQLAGVGENFDSNTNGFTAKGRTQLRKADQAWQRYLALNPEKVDGDLASLMVQAYGQGALDDPAKAVAAQEYAIDSQPASSGLYANLAVLAYQAGQQRKGDLAAARALELAPKEQRDVLKQTLDQAKAGQLGQTGSATGG